MKSIDEIFVPAQKIMEQIERENLFRGQILSGFAKIDQIMSIIIIYHYSKESPNTKLSSSKLTNSNWKINMMRKILQNEKYQSPSFNYPVLIDKTKLLKKIRNQFAHGLVFPGSSQNHAKEEDGKITMAFFENNMWEKQIFDKITQDKLNDDLYSAFRQLRDVYSHIVGRYGEYKQLVL